jgi:alkanesulfonate monooxygenase SsuD/methylene tetrahydromethanopterin reductase-like flavin-dependent oxidoreductase (luciferase family)
VTVQCTDSGSRRAAPLEIGIGLRKCVDIPARAQRFERLGFDTVHCGEHVFFHGSVPHALTALSVAAGATTRIRLLSAVALLPMYPAALLAKMASVLDVASRGRFSLGVGGGGEYEAEFRAVGVPRRERGARADEALEVIRRLFSGESVTYDGRWATIDDLRLQPPPISPGGPEIWIAGRREAAQRRAGRFGDVWMPYMCTPEQLATGLPAVRDAAASAGRKPDEVRGAAFLWTTVHRDGTRARKTIEEVVGAQYDQDFSKMSKYLVAGTPDECIQRLREYQAAGATAVQLIPGCPPEEEDAMLDLLSAEVLPALRT